MADRKMIYLDDAINTMRQHSHYDDFDRSVIDEIVAMKALKDLPSVQPKPDWNELLVICDNCGHTIRIKRVEDDRKEKQEYETD